ncbi:MAG TPA: hypothetical protein O0X18_09765 [Methanocorpusculum sp.]|nr:hypothetical protein [Methanocorpusculum sp.]
MSEAAARSDASALSAFLFFFLPTPMILTPHEITSIRRKIPVFDASGVYVLPRGHLPSRLRL